MPDSRVPFYPDPTLDRILLNRNGVGYEYSLADFLTFIGAVGGGGGGGGGVANLNNAALTGTATYEVISGLVYDYGAIADGGTLTLVNSRNRGKAIFSGATATIALSEPYADGQYTVDAQLTNAGGLTLTPPPNLIRPAVDIDTAATSFAFPANTNGLITIIFTAQGGVITKVALEGDNTGAVPVSQGGTGSTTVQAAFNALATLAIASISDDTFQGLTLTGHNAGEALTQFEVVYLSSAGTWLKADCNGSGTYPARGIVTADVANGAAAIVMITGIVRNDTWAWGTVGGPLYLSGTAGAITQTIPATSGDKIQVVGWADHADRAVFTFNSEYLTLS